MSRQGSMLSVLVVGWTVVVVCQWSIQDVPQRVPLVNTSRMKANQQSPSSASEWNLQGFPTATRESPPIPKRNLFTPLIEQPGSYIGSPRMRMKPVKAHAGNEPSVVASASSAIPAIVPLAISLPSPKDMAEQAGRLDREQRMRKLQDQSAQFRLLGFAERGGVKQAFIRKGSDIYIVRQGDTLEGIFMVSIVAESGVKIRDFEYHLEYTIHMKKDRE